MAAVSHRIFLYCVVLFWMLMALYFLTNNGQNIDKDSYDIQSSMRIMEELQRQNQQLREITAEMRSLERNQEAVGKLEQLLKSLRADLSLCRAKSNELSQRVAQQTLSIDRSRSNTNHLGSTSYAGALALQNQIQEIYYFVNSKTKHFESRDKLPDEIAEDIFGMLGDLKSRTNAALIDVEFLKESEKNVQAREMKLLGEIVQRKIQQLQNPSDCSTAKKIVCDMTKSCGFGCQLHHVTYCLLMAVATDRTLVLDSKGWKYVPEGWGTVFRELSDTCTGSAVSGVRWKGMDANSRDLVVSVPIIDSLGNRPSYLPLSIPEQLAPKLTMYHGNPPAWWIGQLVNYVMRPQDWLAEEIKNFEKKIDFRHPIVGVHIRRTDKVGSEAAFHSIDEYMTYVVDWYDKEDMNRQRLGSDKIERLVYIASDDPSVHSEAKLRFPSYTFLGDVRVSESAGVHTRYNKHSLTGVLCDIVVLSKCDFLVGTFSSQVSRAAYELMQTLHPDASTMAQSLDDIFYFGGQHAHSQKAIYDHEAKPNSEEFSFRAGDTIGIAGNHWDGYSKGVNRRTNKQGLYPSYKVREVISRVRFSSFHGIDELIANITIN